MVLGSWIMEKWRERENKQFADKIDKVYGPETYKRLEQERQERESKGENSHRENGSV